MRYVGIVLLLLILTVTARLLFPDADPPARFADGSQDLITDPAHLTLYARNTVLYGQGDLLDYSGWLAFKVSIVSGLSLILYWLFGISQSTTNAVGMFLNLSGLVLFAIAWRKYVTARAAIYAAIFMAIDFVLALYGRVPFLENGLIFLAGLAFVIYTYWFESWPGKVAIGVVIALCGLVGKSFGFVLLFCPIAYLWFQTDKDRLKSSLVIVGSMAAVIILFSLTLFRDQGLFAFIWSHATEGHGFPQGLQSPGGFVEHLIAFAAKSGLFKYEPVLGLLVYFAFLTVIIRGNLPRDQAKGLLFHMVWFLGSILFMSPFNYLPLRYLFVLIVPMACIASAFFDRMGEPLLPRSKRLNKTAIFLLLLLNWFLIYYIVVLLIASPKTIADYYQYVWYCLAGGVLIGLGQMAIIQSRRLIVPRRFVNGIIMTALLISCGLSVWRYAQWTNVRTYGLVEAGRDLAYIVSPDAVVSGQYGPALATNTKVRCLPYFVTNDIKPTSEFLRKYPVTHLALGRSDWKALTAKYSQLQRASVIARYWVRDNIVYLIRINDVFGNPLSQSYPLSDYEKVAAFDSQQLDDSSVLILDRILAKHPLCKAGLLEKYYMTISDGLISEARPVVETMTEAFSTDFSINTLAAIYYQGLLRDPSGAQFMSRSDMFLKKAIHYNPVNEKNILLMYEQYSLSTRILP
jgi:4-amino-4-deoxy-L-arabinose transferase-like glycosyltransferase